MSEPALDLSILGRLEQLGGKKLVSELIQMYLDKTPEKMDHIHSGLNNLDYSEIERAAHSLISSSGNLGGMTVSDLAAQVEAAAMQENMELLTQLMPDIDLAEEALRAALNAELEKV